MSTSILDEQAQPEGELPDLLLQGHDPGCAHLDYSACNCSKATVSSSSPGPSSVSSTSAHPDSIATIRIDSRFHAWATAKYPQLCGKAELYPGAERDQLTALKDAWVSARLLDMAPVMGEGVEVSIVPPAADLDEVVVYWRNLSLGKGHVTVTCWGNAWTGYFGGMGERTIQQFVAGADTSYLVNKLGITPHLKQTKRDHAYLARVINAVKKTLPAPDRGLSDGAGAKLEKDAQ